MPLFVTVVPGATVTEDTVMDPSTFNQLGTPTVDITGTIDGSSSIQNAAGSVTNTMMANMDAQTVKANPNASTAGAPQDVPLGGTLIMTGGVLKVKDASITSTQLASATTTAAGAIADTNIATGIIGPNKLKAQTALTLLGNGGDTASAAPEPILIGSGITVTNADELNTATRSRSSNVATITTGSAHNYNALDKINITGVSGTGYNAYGVTCLSGTTGSTIKYDSVGNDESSTSDTGGKVRRIEASGSPTTTLTVASSPIKAFCLFNAAITSNVPYTKSGTTVTLTLAGHTVEVGDLIAAGDNTADVAWGMFTVIGVVAGSTISISDPSAFFTGSSGVCRKRSTVKSSYNISKCDGWTSGQVNFNFTNALTNNKYVVVTSSWHGVTLMAAPYSRATMTTTSFILSTYNASGGSAGLGANMSEGQYFSMCVMQ